MARRFVPMFDSSDGKLGKKQKCKNNVSWEKNVAPYIIYIYIHIYIYTLCICVYMLHYVYMYICHIVILAQESHIFHFWYHLVSNKSK